MTQNFNKPGHEHFCEHCSKPISCEWIESQIDGPCNLDDWYLCFECSHIDAAKQAESLDAYKAALAKAYPPEPEIPPENEWNETVDQLLDKYCVDVIEEIVHDAAAQLAANANNEGRAGQVNFLKVVCGWSDEDICHAINERVG